MITDRLLNETIDVQARNQGWTKWRVDEEREIFFFESGLFGIVGGIGVGNVTTISPAIIVVPDLTIHVRHTNAAATIYSTLYVSFYRNASRTDVIHKSLAFRVSYIMTDGAGVHHYRGDIVAPVVFFNNTSTKIGVDSTAGFANLVGWGKALIIHKLL